MADEPAKTPRKVTSVEIGRRARGLCWAFGLTLISAGGVATFISTNQAGTTALILFGGLLLFIAITKRVPLLIEVGTARLDTSYEAIDEVFEAGRESAVTVPSSESADEHPQQPMDYGPILTGAYRGAIAARAAGITYRQLDYWARTQLVEPSISRPEPDGNRRQFYSTKDVFTLAFIKSMLDAGISLQEIRKMTDEFTPVPLDELMNLTLVHEGRISRLVQAWHPDQRASPTVVIPLEPIAARVLGELHNLGGA